MSDDNEFGFSCADQNLRLKERIFPRHLRGELPSAPWIR